MAEGLESTFKIYQDQYQSGKFEVESQEVNAFNAASAGAIELVTLAKLGDYEQAAFFQDISTLVSRRDVTSTSAVAALDMTQDDMVSVKINRKVGPVEKTVSSFLKIGATPQLMSLILGQMVAKKKLADYLNTGLLAAEAAIQGVGTTLNYDATGLTTKTLSYATLIAGLAKMGDRAKDVVCWVMHSKPYFDLMSSASGVLVSEVAGLTIAQGSVASLGRPIIWTDSAALTDANGSSTDSYNVLGLVKGALTVTESEPDLINVEGPLGGHEQLFMRIQGEHAYNLSVKGFQWDIGNGGKNPTDAYVGTTTYWDKIATSIKDCAGVRIIVQ